MNKKGFTLIELLVVIAIIGILASVVLASLNSARQKGAVAAGKSNMANARAQAELFYDSNGNSYDGGTAATDVCNASASATGNIKGINPSVLAGAQANTTSATVSVDAAGPATASLGICNSSATAWAAEVVLKDGNFYCVDSVGASKSAAGVMLGAANDYTC